MNLRKDFQPKKQLLTALHNTNAARRAAPLDAAGQHARARA